MKEKTKPTLRGFSLHQAQGTRYKEHRQYKKVQKERSINQPGQQSLSEGGG